VNRPGIPHQLDIWNHNDEAGSAPRPDARPVRLPRSIKRRKEGAGAPLAAVALGTGSTGNAYVVIHGETKLLIDCGLGIRDLTRRLLAVGLEPKQLTAIVLTHGHDDHVRGVVRAAREGDGISIYATAKSYQAALAKAPETSQPHAPPVHNEIRAGKTFAIGSIEVTPMAVPHDWPSTLGFVFSDGGGRRIGLATDVGWAEEKLLDGLSKCDLIFYEFNHDADLLRIGPYPPYLKMRVAGPGGHLANDAAAESLGRLLGADAKRLVAVHLSRTNNRTHLVEDVLARSLERLGSRIPTYISLHDHPTPLFAAVETGINEEENIS